MNVHRVGRPSPALAVAVIALFVALAGTAGAVGTAVVPLAKRALSADKAKTALVADNAKKIGGQTAQKLAQQASAQAAQMPGPASSAGGIVSVRTQSIGQLAPNQGRPVSISCDAGAKVLGGGFSSDGPVYNFDSYPSGDATWSMYLANPDDSTGHAVTLYATCIK
jgi:hypothetical protein